MDKIYLFIAESVLLCVNTKSTYQEREPRKAGYSSGHGISLRAH